MTTDHIYMRLTNPTNRILEEKLTTLEGGQGAIVMASGMAAIANACLALLRSGDEFVTGNSLFMSTYLLFTGVFKKYGITTRLDKVWREHHINFGTTQAPMHAYLTMIGLDTLALRMERHMANALEVARYLRKRPEVSWINYPGLEDHPSHSAALKQFGAHGFGGMLAFGLKNEECCFQFINSLSLIHNLANLGDCKTLVIHPYSSQYVSFDDPTREHLSITDDMIRLSIGIEDIGDICEDLGQALDSISQ
jgi:O-acetylhomoserine (thiol)-lyase